VVNADAASVMAAYAAAVAEAEALADMAEVLTGRAPAALATAEALAAAARRALTGLVPPGAIARYEALDERHSAAEARFARAMGSRVGRHGGDGGADNTLTCAGTHQRACRAPMAGTS
jgi:hypothetical protein